MSEIQQPPAGLTVLDMTSLAMGPLAGQVLGDYGANVIKVEPPAEDAFRHTLPRRFRHGNLPRLRQVLAA